MSPTTEFVNIWDKYICVNVHVHTSTNVSNFYKSSFLRHFITFCKLLAVELYTVFSKCQVHGLNWLLKLLQIM